MNDSEWGRLNTKSKDDSTYADVQLLHCEEKANFISLIYRLQLSSKGRGQVIFNTSLLNIFTIAVENNSTKALQGHIELSPDHSHYKVDNISGSQTIKEGTLELFVSTIFMKYTAIVLEGAPGSKAYVYFQGQYSC